MPDPVPVPAVPPMPFRWRALARFGSMTFLASTPADLAREALAAVEGFYALTGDDELVLESRSYYRHPYAGLQPGWRRLGGDWPDDPARVAEALPGRAESLWREAMTWYAPVAPPSAEAS
jgi:hypothetical protein